MGFWDFVKYFYVNDIYPFFGYVNYVYCYDMNGPRTLFMAIEWARFGFPATQVPTLAEFKAKWLLTLINSSYGGVGKPNEKTIEVIAITDESTIVPGVCNLQIRAYSSFPKGTISKFTFTEK